MHLLLHKFVERPQFAVNGRVSDRLQRLCPTLLERIPLRGQACADTRIDFVEALRVVGVPDQGGVKLRLRDPTLFEEDGENPLLGVGGGDVIACDIHYAVADVEVHQNVLHLARRKNSARAA